MSADVAAGSLSFKKVSLALESRAAMLHERRVLPALVLLLALVAGTAIGTLCHHHGQDPTADCAICHTGHAAVVEPGSSHWLPGFEPLGRSLLPEEPSSVTGPAARRTPSRAPPFA